MRLLGRWRAFKRRHLCSRWGHDFEPLFRLWGPRVCTRCGLAVDGSPTTKETR